MMPDINTMRIDEEKNLAAFVDRKIESAQVSHGEYLITLCYRSDFQSTMNETFNTAVVELSLTNLVKGVNGYVGWKG